MIEGDKIWVVTEHHKAEGGSILAVLTTKPTREDVQRIQKRSPYSDGEFQRWCQIDVDCFLLNGDGELMSCAHWYPLGG